MEWEREGREGRDGNGRVGGEGREGGDPLRVGWHTHVPNPEK